MLPPFRALYLWSRACKRFALAGTAIAAGNTERLIPLRRATRAPTPHSGQKLLHSAATSEELRSCAPRRAHLLPLPDIAYLLLLERFFSLPLFLLLDEPQPRKATGDDHHHGENCVVDHRSCPELMFIVMVAVCYRILCSKADCESSKVTLSS